MADFDIAYKVMEGNEGGYVNDPKDRGGETYAGITRINFPNWAGWATVDKVKPKNKQVLPELKPLVKQFYKDEFWRFGGIENQKLATFIFDWYVNSKSNAIKALQRIVKVSDDGKYGNMTERATNGLNADDVLADMVTARKGYYLAIAENDPSQNRFLKGWLNRVDNLA